MVKFNVGEEVEHFITTGMRRIGTKDEMIVTRWKVKVVEIKNKVITVKLPNGMLKKCQTKNLSKIS